MARLQRVARSFRPVLAAAVLGTSLLLAAAPAQAWLGALANLGKAAGTAGKAAGTVGKGAAAGAGAVGGAEAVNAAGQAGRAAKAGGAAEGAAAASADDISRASGLGKAVPDEVAAMLTTPGKTLADVPDPGARSWLATPPAKLTRSDANLIVRDYVALLEGKAAAGPQPGVKLAAPPVATSLPATKPPSQVPWFAVEMLMRAGDVGHRGAELELDRLCLGQPPATLAESCRARGARGPKT